MAIALLILRVVVGGLFMFSGLLKLLQPYQNFLYVIHSYEIVSGTPARILAITIPWLEFLLGIFVISGLWLRRSISGLWALSTMFIVVLFSAMARNLPIKECGCFGDSFSLPPQQMIRVDTVIWLILAVLWRMADKTKHWSLDALFGEPDARSKKNISTLLRVLVGVTAASLVAVLLFKFSNTSAAKPDPSLLASVGKEGFSAANLPPQKLKELASLEAKEYELLSESAYDWADNLILLKEAIAKKQSFEDFLASEVAPKAAVTDEEIQQVYSHLIIPNAVTDVQAWEEIKNFLVGQKVKAKRHEIASALYPKYSVHFYAKAPKGYVAGQKTTAFFEKYKPYQRMAPVGPTLGPVDAPVVLEIFSDFMCPFSAKFTQTMKTIRETYGDKVRVDFRQYPLPFHKGADKLGEMSLCVAEQGKFWQFHDAIYANLGKTGEGALTTDQIIASLGLEMGKFNPCVASGKYREAVQRDIQEGKRRGVSGTPSFFINGKFQVGAQPFESLKPRLDWLLDPNAKGPAPAAPQPAAPRQPSK